MMYPTKKRSNKRGAISSALLSVLAGALILGSGFVMGVVAEKIWRIAPTNHEQEDQLAFVHTEFILGDEVAATSQIPPQPMHGNHPVITMMMVHRLRNLLDLEDDQVTQVIELVGEQMAKLQEVYGKLKPEVDAIHRQTSQGFKQVLNEKQYQIWLNHFNRAKSYQIEIQKRYGGPRGHHPGRHRFRKKSRGHPMHWRGSTKNRPWLAGEAVSEGEGPILKIKKHHAPKK